MRVLIVLAAALAVSVAQVPPSLARRPPPPPVLDGNGQVVFPLGGGCVDFYGSLICQFGDAPAPSKPSKPKPKPKPKP
jgi:hypothetical protein